MDHVEEHGTEALLHVRADPDQEPIVKLYGGGQNSTNTGARTDGNATAEEVGEIRETSELRWIKLARNHQRIAGTMLTFISRV